MTTMGKTCKGCGQLKSCDAFVNIYGHPNPRGKYCTSCYLRRERQHVMELMDGRDFCLYCGRTIVKFCDYDVKGRSLGSQIELDHMNPVSLGGHDTCGLINLETGESLDDGQNTVYCCRECNRKKSNTLFVDWVKSLAPQFQALAIEVYKQKHDGRLPDAFNLK